jgi:ABC-type uncharacterized transport system substrate-binding protein
MHSCPDYPGSLHQLISAVDDKGNIPMMKVVCMTLLCLFGAPVLLFSHPHMAIDAYLEFELDGGSCRSIKVELTFDPIFSAAIIGEYDRDRNGEFDLVETESLRDGAFENLNKFGYFVFLREGTYQTNPKHVTDFQAEKKGYFLVYRFRVPLGGTVFAESDDFSVAIFDSTYYCQIIYPSTAARAVGLDGGKPAASARISHGLNMEFPVYYNPSGSPNDGRVYTQWERGLQTAFPDEIRIRIGL